jgi:DNA mismatch repair ATPase MutS
MPIKGLTQSTDSLNLIENNRNLRRGLECFEQLKQKRHEADSLRAVIDSFMTASAYRDNTEWLLNDMIADRDLKLQEKDSTICDFENKINICQSAYADFKKKKRLTDCILGAFAMLISIL